MRIGYYLHEEKSVAKYSESLLRGVVLNQKLSLMAPHEDDVINFNSACVFFSVAFLEARLNEIITGIAIHGSSAKEVPAKHWELLKQREKSTSLQEKWDYLASAYGGKLWKAGEDPHQSFELISSLRNHLIHYKGDALVHGEAPQKKLQELLKIYKGGSGDYASQAIIEVFGKGKRHWLEQLLSSREFGRWIATVTLEFDVKEKLFLTGKDVEPEKRSSYWSKWHQALPMSKEASECNMNKIEKVLEILEKVVLPSKEEDQASSTAKA